MKNLLLWFFVTGCAGFMLGTQLGWRAFQRHIQQASEIRDRAAQLHEAAVIEREHAVRMADRAQALLAESTTAAAHRRMH